MSVKRMFDFCFALIGLHVSLPLWPIFSLIIWLNDGMPIFYMQERVGRDGRIFKSIKFRSMIKKAEDRTGPVWSKEEDSRIIKVGRVLRATAMDELPQLWNILKGDMSFVGPRSERPFFVEKFLKEIPGYEKRFSVRSGLTGIAQVYGRYDTPPQKKLEYDLEYIRRMNIFLDLKLILLSFIITFSAGWTRFEKNK